jgi:hypothetical protein
LNERGPENARLNGESTEILYLSVLSDHFFVNLFSEFCAVFCLVYDLFLRAAAEKVPKLIDKKRESLFVLSNVPAKSLSMKAINFPFDISCGFQGCRLWTFAVVLFAKM